MPHDLPDASASPKRRKPKTGRKPGGKRPGAGRPKNPNRLRPEHRVHVSMYPEQRLFLEAIAQVDAVTVPEAVRSIVTKAMRATMGRERTPEGATH